MTGGLALLALSLALLTPSPPTVAPPRSAAVLLLRVAREPSVPASAPQEALRRLLSPESEVRVPVPPPAPPAPAAVEPPSVRTPPKPAPPVAAPKTPPVKKKTPRRVRPGVPPPPAPAASTAQEAPVAAPALAASAAPAPGPDAGAAEAQRKEKALAAILDALNRHKKYPKQARRTGAEGTAQLLVTVSPAGKVGACALGKGSGHRLLDAATERLGEKLEGLDVAEGGKGFQVLVPVRYSLKDAS